MRKAMIVGLMALAVVKVHAGQKAGETLCEVRAYLEDQQVANPRVLFRAEAMAVGMFAGIGVRLRWELAAPRPARSPKELPDTEIVIRFATKTPAGFHPGAQGYALPYAQSGVQITLFYDRVLGPAVGTEGAASVLLAHALVHEITHVLQGVARHSAQGVMKAQWTPEDRAQMKQKPLPFTDYDVELIRLAMASRQGAVQIAAR
jgi:hypothetical protein